MSFHVVLIIVIVVLGLLALGGGIAAARRRRPREAGFRAEIERADHALADAFAADQGWSRDRLEAAARANWPGDPGGELQLVSVIDEPGTEADRATFRGPDGTELELRRRGDDWHPAR